MPDEGLVKEIRLLDGKPTVWIQCDPSLIPAPGQYLSAYADASNSPLAGSIFSIKSLGNGFLAAPPIPALWTLGMRLHLRGPLGNGFVLPKNARRVGLIAFDTQEGGGDSSGRLLPLLDVAVRQEASIVLVCQIPPAELPFQIEVQPLNALMEVYNWADYLAIDARRESLPELRKMIGMRSQLMIWTAAQILIRTPMPCGALAECGVCAVQGRFGQLLVCKDGPVFTLNDLLD